MLHAPSSGQLAKETGPGSRFETRIKLFRTAGMIVAGLFAGTVIGGIVGLFVYANSRTPNAHDGVFAVIQVVGVLVGLFMGYVAARGAEAQDQMIEASYKASLIMLKKYKPKPGAGGNSTVGERVIGPVHNAGEEFLKTLLNSSARTNGASDTTSSQAN
ncbi:MAG: hypothetical protein JOY87_08945 [Candidatus Eremiobacteraeota bacterium]|nr:hypothetical protein [Candidatus Eremiobacteraeota bacterium]